MKREEYEAPMTGESVGRAYELARVLEELGGSSPEPEEDGSYRLLGFKVWVDEYVL